MNEGVIIQVTYNYSAHNTEPWAMLIAVMNSLPVAWRREKNETTLARQVY